MYEPLERARDFVREYYLETPCMDGISRPKDNTGTPIDGALCLDTGKPGPTVLVLAMEHLSEPSGLAAHEDIIARWKSGSRPPSGKIILSLGHTTEHVLGFLDKTITKLKAGEEIDYDDDHILDEERAKVLGPALWSQAKGHILSLHSLPMKGDPLIFALYPEISKEPILDRQSAIQHYIEHGIDAEQTATKIAPLVKGMPVHHVVTDLYEPLQYRDDFSRIYGSFSALDPKASPLILETGGPNLEESCRQVAKHSTQAWLNNVLGWKPQVSLPKKQPHYYRVTEGVAHISKTLDREDTVQRLLSNPAEGMTEEKTRQLIDGIANDTYFLLGQPNLSEKLESKKAKEIARSYDEKYPESPLQTFGYIKKGHPVCIGSKTGFVIPAPTSGYFVFGHHSVNPETAKDSYQFVISKERFRLQHLAREEGGIGEKLTSR